MINKGLLVVLSSPSGGGKTTVAQKLLQKDKNLVRSVSCTTRKPRPGEKNGKDYFFISRRDFLKKRSEGAFLEWAEVHKNLYGTPKSWVEAQLKKGRDVLFVIDVQGGKALKKLNPEALLVFLKPPSLAVLRKRLEGRKSEEAKALSIRLKGARWELEQGGNYDHHVVNDRLPKAVSDVLKIIRAERKRQITG